MRNQLILSLIALVLVASGCNPFEGKQEMTLQISNKTRQELVIEQYIADNPQSYILTVVKCMSETDETYSGWVSLGRADATNAEGFPVESEFTSKIGQIRIYRTVESGKQYLPESKYNSTSCFGLEDGGWDMGVHYVTYSLSITEDMFDE